MEASTFDLGKLLAPIQVDAFLNETWEKKPLILHRDTPEQYAKLFSIGDLDSVIAFSQPRFTDSSAFPNRPPSSPSCAQGYLADQQLGPRDIFPNVAEIHQVYSQGKTVVIRGMQHRWPAIALLCRNLERIFQCPVHANLYLTPRKSQGFDAHIDPHEVFALQIDGIKHWRLYGQAVELPLVGDRAMLDHSRLGEPEEIKLRPGDLLYLPRGHAHDAFTSDQSSLHLTLGVNIYRWADLLRHALDRISRTDPRFRESIPSGVLLSSDVAPQVDERFRQLLAVLAENASAADAIGRLGDEFIGGLAVLPHSRFAAPKCMDEIGPETVLAKCPGAVCRCSATAETATIHFPGGHVSGPARIGPALRFIAESERFLIRDLPNNLGAEGKLVLSRRLVREGLLMIESQTGQQAASRMPNGPATRLEQVAASV
jgi:ribosomal protein L16 Arg81 hydroxylase